jgi:hypothetical protein
VNHQCQLQAAKWTARAIHAFILTWLGLAWLTSVIAGKSTSIECRLKWARLPQPRIRLDVFWRVSGWIVAPRGEWVPVRPSTHRESASLTALFPAIDRTRVCRLLCQPAHRSAGSQIYGSRVFSQTDVKAT